MIFGAVGILRFPDMYTRLHASTKTDTGGAMTILIATAMLTTPWIVRIKILILIFLIAMINPMLSHAIARGGHKWGIKPIVVVDMYDKDNP